MSDYSRQYTSGVSWENLSSTATPISAGNLNKMDNAILHIDEAAYTAINTKANQTTVNGCINNIAFESTTGVFTITFVNGSTTTINTALEKVVTNFTYNSATQSLVLTLEDGSTQSISLAEFITQYEFEDTDTIDFTVTDGKVSAIVKNGSITGEKLNPNYLTQITSQVNSAKDYARQSQSYALGNAVDDEGDPYREGQATDNAKYYYQKAHEAASEAGAEPFIGATSSTGGTQGLVPGPLIADKDKFLSGSGGWESDTSKLLTNFTSSDNASETGLIVASGETSMAAVTSGDTHGGLFGLFSKSILNTRKLINTVKRVWNTVASSWASGETYAVGDVRLWTNGHTYVCKLAHTSSSSITPANTTYWDDKTLGDMIASLNSNYANLSSAFGNSTLQTMRFITKRTFSSSGTVQFQIPVYYERLAGFLLITQNGASENSVYVFQTNQKGALTTSKLIGDTVNITKSNDSTLIEVSVSSWSVVSMLVPLSIVQ